MGLSVVENIEDKEFSPKEIRELLGIDNVKIQELCKLADIKLKRNDRGLTYFTKDDADLLSKFSSQTSLTASNPIMKTSHHYANSSVSKLMESLKDVEKSVIDKITSILDEKLDGMDDVVMELIRVKTENETLKFKINELNKESYKLKKELNSFKKVPFGFYAKTSAGENCF